MPQARAELPKTTNSHTNAPTSQTMICIVHLLKAGAARNATALVSKLNLPYATQAWSILGRLEDVF